MRFNKFIFTLLLIIFVLEAGFAQRESTPHALLTSRDRIRQNSHLIDRARRLEDEKRFDRVIKLLRDVLSSGKINDYKIYCELGFAYAQNRDLERAKKYLENAITLQPDFPIAHNQLGRLVYKQNRTASFMALFFYNLLAPHSIEASQNLSYLKELLIRPVFTASHNEKPLDDFSSVDAIMNAKNSINQSLSNDYPAYFLMRLDWLCISLMENSADQTSFFWRFYAPYFIDMYKLHYSKAAVWSLFGQPAEDPELANEVKGFNKWSKKYILKRLYDFSD